MTEEEWLACTDPQKMLDWVRDNTRLVPYEGSLRGALGVLMDRNGNSLDRSILLARLLELPRVRGELPRAQGFRLRNTSL